MYVGKIHFFVFIYLFILKDINAGLENELELKFPKFLYVNNSQKIIAMKDIYSILKISFRKIKNIYYFPYLFISRDISARIEDVINILEAKNWCARESERINWKNGRLVYGVSCPRPSSMHLTSDRLRPSKYQCNNAYRTERATHELDVAIHHVIIMLVIRVSYGTV